MRPVLGRKDEPKQAATAHKLYRNGVRLMRFLCITPIYKGGCLHEKQILKTDMYVTGIRIARQYAPDEHFCGGIQGYKYD